MPKIELNSFDCHNDNGNDNDHLPKDNGFTFTINKTIQLQRTNGTDLPIEKLNKIQNKSNNHTNSSIHSPKVFTANSVTVNTPAKHVLGSNYNNFTRNLKHTNIKMPAESAVLIEVNKPSSANSPKKIPITNATTTNSINGHNLMNGNGHQHGNNIKQLGKLQPVSACYDRYPKPGSYGNIQVYPMNGINSEINNTKENVRQTTAIDIPTTLRHHRTMQSMDDELSKIEQDRLEEILKMCADFERQNQNVQQSSPIVQNRIKTNGSLPREKKSPISPDHIGTANVFFPSSPCDFRQQASKSPQSFVANVPSGYENVYAAVSSSKFELSPPSSHQQNGHCNGNGNGIGLGNGNVYYNGNGYENIMPNRKSPATFVPQSPRTRIKTCISPKKELNTSTPIQRKTDYDLLVQSFEEKLRLEIQQLREHRNLERHFSRNEEPIQMPNESRPTLQSNQMNSPSSKTVNNGQYSILNESVSSRDGIYGTLTNTNKIKSVLKMNAKRSLDDNQITQLKRQRTESQRTARDLRSQISELQRQEEELLRELELERALVSAELAAEQAELIELEEDRATLMAKIHRLEAQRNANRVLQETQQNKLKQSIDMKQSQINGLKQMLITNDRDESVRDELNEVIELLENDQKLFEDLEFQYLEEETEWSAYREDLHSEQRILMARIAEKKEQIEALNIQDVDNQACIDTKQLEQKLLSMMKNFEKCREELQTIDTLLYELSGEKTVASDSDDGDLSAASFNRHKRRPSNDIMSQSLFGSQEILVSKKNNHNTDLMSKSVNENLFSCKIEALPFTDQLLTKANEKIDPKKSENNASSPTAYGRIDATDYSNSMKRHSFNGTAGESMMNGYDPTTTVDSLQKLKYNLSPPFEHKFTSNDQLDDIGPNAKRSNLNLSIESDDFEVNPLEKRVPSQDDIDRICKVTTDAPISTQGASIKVIESIKEIERNRQLLLAQQGSHVIEHERQKMFDLKKKIQDEARAQYLQLQNHGDDRYPIQDGSLEYVNSDRVKKIDGNLKPAINKVGSLQKDISLSNSPRHSHPEYECERPLSEVNSEFSYDALSDKHMFKSSNDIHHSNGRIYGDHDGSGSSQRGSLMSSENSESGRMISGARRNLPKHQRPLTRYLPIMSADLDLRLHIESAGHQVTLCPHVKVDSFSCRGYLHKLGATFHGWSKRWFVLDRQKMAFMYYSDKSERKPRGGAYFSTIDEVYLDHLNASKSGRPHCTFIVKTKRRSYHLQAPSDATARIWIDAIITGAQGNIDY